MTAVRIEGGKPFEREEGDVGVNGDAVEAEVGVGRMGELEAIE
jgi:hypothetical protein